MLLKCSQICAFQPSLLTYQELYLLWKLFSFSQHLTIASCCMNRGVILCLVHLFILGFGLDWACTSLKHAFTSTHEFRRNYFYETTAHRWLKSFHPPLSQFSWILAVAGCGETLMKTFYLGINALRLSLYECCPTVGLCVSSHLLQGEVSLMRSEFWADLWV